MKKFKLFPGAIFALIGLNFVIVAVTVTLATGDPSVSAEPDYYAKAVAWDESVHAREASRKLGWTADITVPAPGQVAIALTDSGRSPVAGAAVTIEAFPNIRSSQRQALTAVEAAPGRYVAAFDCTHTGLWQFRIQATRGESRFLDNAERQVGALKAATPNNAARVGGS